RVRDVLAAGTLAADVTQTVKERLASQRASLVVERQELPCKISALSSEGRRLVEAQRQWRWPAASRLQVARRSASNSGEAGRIRGHGPSPLLPRFLRLSLSHRRRAAPAG
ncbi:MAG: hypothetical protein WBP56_26675, partial [Polyangia bacterium]